MTAIEILRVSMPEVEYGHKEYNTNIAALSFMIDPRSLWRACNYVSEFVQLME